jgi:hypothetical protein
MTSVFDLLPTTVKPFIVRCKSQRHEYDRTKASECPTCGDTEFRIPSIRDRDKIREKTQLYLGTVCSCCSATDDLYVVLKQSTPTTRSRWSLNAGRLPIRDIDKNLGRYVLLCVQCADWKNDGPVCPCKHWDETHPGWRDALSLLKCT